jgi:hypothetical protein
MEDVPSNVCIIPAMDRFLFIRNGPQAGLALADACLRAEKAGGRVLSVLKESFFLEVNDELVAAVALELPGWRYSIDPTSSDADVLPAVIQTSRVLPPR